MHTNDNITPEAFVSCCKCNRKFHVICVRFLDALSPNGFSCDRCLTGKELKNRPSRFTAEKLAKSTLSDYIETRVNNRLIYR